MENIVDLPGQGQFELVHQIGELVFDLEWSMPLTCKFRGRLISGKVCHLKPNGRSHCKAWVIALPFVINSLQYFLRPLNSMLAFLLSLTDLLNSFIQVGGLSGIWNVCKHRMVTIVSKEQHQVDQGVVVVIIQELCQWE